MTAARIVTREGASLVGEPWGDSAVLFTAAGGSPDARWRAGLDLHRALGDARIAGLEDWIHAFESVLVSFDCTDTDAQAVTAAVHDLLAAAGRTGIGAQVRRFEIPVVFGGEHGPDLESVAAEVGRTPADLIAYLVSGDIVIGSVGGTFMPLMQRHGQPFAVRRMPSPRTHVPAGSLGLAGDRTCFYAVDQPGGWRLIGRTPVPLFDSAADPPVPYRAGDVVRLRAIGADDPAASSAPVRPA